MDYASVFNLLGNEQKNDRLYKSRAQKFELFNLQLGFFKDIRNQLPINTSFDEWANLVSGSENKDNNSEFFDQDSWYGSSRYFAEFRRWRYHSVTETFQGGRLY